MKTMPFQHQTWFLAIGFILLWNSGFIGSVDGHGFYGGASTVITAPQSGE